MYYMEFCINVYALDIKYIFYKKKKKEKKRKKEKERKKKKKGKKKERKKIDKKIVLKLRSEILQS